MWEVSLFIPGRMSLVVVFVSTVVGDVSVTAVVVLEELVVGGGEFDGEELAVEVVAEEREVAPGCELVVLVVVGDGRFVVVSVFDIRAVVGLLVSLVREFAVSEVVLRTVVTVVVDVDVVGVVVVDGGFVVEDVS